MSDLSLRPVDERTDTRLLYELYVAARSWEMAVFEGADDQKLAFLTMQHQAQHLDTTSRYPDASHQVVQLGSDAIGRLWVDRSPDRITVLDLSILPSYQRRGFATELLEDLKDEAVASSCVVRHWLYAPHRRTGSLYQRLGFTTRQQRGDYQIVEWTPPTSNRPFRQ